MKLLEITMSDVKPGLTSIIPIGSIEQHGPHLPLGTDSIIVQYLVDVINEKFNDKVLVCPTIYITCSFEHLGFPGTLTIEYTTLLKYLLELFKSLRDSCSVKSIVIVNGHGGIIDVINLAVKKWNYTNIGIKAYHYYIYNESVLRKIKSLLGLEELDDFQMWRDIKNKFQNAQNSFKLFRNGVKKKVIKYVLQLADRGYAGDEHKIHIDKDYLVPLETSSLNIQWQLLEQILTVSKYGLYTRLHIENVSKKDLEVFFGINSNLKENSNYEVLILASEGKWILEKFREK